MISNDPKNSRHGVTICHGGKEYRLSDFEEALDEARDLDDQETLGALLAALDEGDIIGSDGEPMPRGNANRLRTRLRNPEARFSALERLKLAPRASDGERRFVIPGLQPWGTFPLLTGQPKAGKTTLVADYVAALMDSNRSFVDRFPAATLTLEERNRGIVVINAETPPEDFEDELLRQVGSELMGYVAVIHLELLPGGAASYDVTELENFERSSDDLVDCTLCDGEDDWTPVCVIVDGLTAILAAAGKGTDSYGRWIARFRAQMRELNIPNGLIVAHSTLAGTHSMGGTSAIASSDGNWNYRMSDPDNAASIRRFSTVPRIGGVAVPPTRVRLVDGRLRADKATGEPESASGEDASSSISGSDVIELRVLAFVREHHLKTGGWPTKSQFRSVIGTPARVEDARAALVEKGSLLERKLQRRGGGIEYALPEEVDA